MAQFCEICHKGRKKVNSWKKIMSKWDPTKTYFQKPNLKTVKLQNGKKITICAKCHKKLIQEGKI